jgi:hypothetical protein
MKRRTVFLSCVAGLVLTAGPALAQAIPTPILPTPTTAGNVAPVPTPVTGIPTPGGLPPAIPGPVPALTPSQAPTPPPGNIPIPLDVPHPEIGPGSGPVPTIPGVVDHSKDPVVGSVLCEASWYDLYGKAVCSMVNQSQKDTASSLKMLRKVLHIPDITGNSEFISIYESLTLVVDALLLGITVYAAILIIFGEWTYAEAKQLAPRLLVAVAGANLTVPILHRMIMQTNAIVGALLTVDPSSLQPGGDPTSQGIAFVVLGIFMLVIVVLLVIENLMAWSVLGVGAGFGGVANCFFVTEKTEQVARHWWRMVFWLCMSPILQAFVLVLTVQVFLNSSPEASGFLFDNALRMGVLLILFSIPLICIKLAMSGKGPGKVIKLAYLARKLVTKGI